MQQLEEKLITQDEGTPATGLKVVWREFKKDKLALASLIVLVGIIAVTFVWAFMINKEELMQISLYDEFAEPGTNGFILGADQGGSDVLGQLIIGARNSLTIAIAITVITGVLGVAIGLAAGYFGGIVDAIIMRVMDFYMTLPTLMIIIVFVTIIPKYNVVTFVLIMSAFLWIGTARLIRSKVLSEGNRDYVNASKTMGTGNFAIMFKGILPNISSLLIVELTLNFAGNVGIETGLSFLGFGLPPDVPSLGTLVGAASNPVVLENNWWVWFPASMLILILMLAINYVGQALRRAADSKQRLG
ncbi:peptide ABC transporter permease [Kurthia zopfii]|uniref:Dipeptide transport system permease protein dppC n=1 Tax=Kurthia zopfii TaxID=1650 RepID=A0A2U3AET7_9BACL|nr:ABC transporter permease [Kurthia zopfii]PWI23053.1 peptide ABC transporter permease [Kurthia zopfii]TDR40513.1 peptide/nickel transport system permease protein [Kurthia zopfii]STX10252.1 Dipeptide transport system permease protein dppC [Kurthia zopfii]VEI08181.1 Dipeptide transport system permease protein dppC [Kurthia zopfii]GEK30072.1 peptide ABC transporter permease [Kurthia zopfii]